MIILQTSNTIKSDVVLLMEDFAYPKKYKLKSNFILHHWFEGW